MNIRCYSLDFRHKLLAFLSIGHTIKQASETFGISEKTINNWNRQLKEEGHVRPKETRRRKPRKIEDSALRDYLAKHPDAFLQEIADHFNCKVPSVAQRLKLLKITRKKNYAIRREK